VDDAPEIPLEALTLDEAKAHSGLQSGGSCWIHYLEAGAIPKERRPVVWRGRVSSRLHKPA
jgi:hypothetical protein